ncbi:MAG: hypothetical protein AB8G96_07925 [Phycisphaerales bacterium]
MKKNLIIGAVASVAMASVASADVAGVSIMDLGNVTGAPEGTNTWQVVVSFDALDDALLAVGGISGLAPLSFQSSSPLIQNSGAFNGLANGDVPSVLDAGGDSWVSMGLDPLTSNTSFSPGFGGGDGASSVIMGSSFMETDGGYFDQNPGTVVGGVGDVVIAQFTLAAGEDFTYSGLVNWKDDTLPSGEFFSTEFSVTTIPAPGALALLGVAGLIGRRRRG